MARPHAWIAAPGLGFLMAAALLAAAATSADPAPAAAVAVPALQLRDGRVLHDARVVSDEGDSVVIRADEGLVKVAKADLPQAVAASYPVPSPTPVAPQMVMMPFDPSPQAAPPVPETRPKPKPAPANAPIPAQTSHLVYRGCTIVSFQMKPFQETQGAAEVVIRNDTDAPVVIFARNIVCVTASGGRQPARFIVTDGFPPVVKRREVVPAQGSIDDTFGFSGEAIDISGVQWAR